MKRFFSMLPFIICLILAIFIALLVIVLPAFRAF